jgi:outer membrane protein assembly factor BamB
VKHHLLPTPPRLAVALIILVIGGALFTTACRRLAKPIGWASPVATGDLLLVPHRDKLFALDAETLDQRWRFPLPDDKKTDLIALYATPTVVDDTVVLPAYDDWVYAKNVDTGEARWQFETGGPIVGGAAGANGLLYVGSSDGNVYALDESNGSQRWVFETGNEVRSQPTVAGSVVYATSLDKHLYALNAQSGELLWSFETGAGITSPALVSEADGLAFVGGLDSTMRAIDTQTHDERWSSRADNWFQTKPLLAGGTLYAGSMDKHVYAWDAATGELRWRFATVAPVQATPLLLGDTLLVVDWDGAVYFIQVSDGQQADDPVILHDDVRTDPLLLQAPSGSGEGDRVLFTTSGGELVFMDPETHALDRRPLEPPQQAG